MTDPANSTTHYEYDNRDRLTKRIDASGKFETYEYDLGSRLVQHTDRKGQVTSFQYDANDRLVKTTYADRAVVTRSYDAEDRLLSINDTAPGAGEHQFNYDLLDRLTRETTPRGNVAYEYDGLGRGTML